MQWVRIKLKIRFEGDGFSPSPDSSCWNFKKIHQFIIGYHPTTIDFISKAAFNVTLLMLLEFLLILQALEEKVFTTLWRIYVNEQHPITQTY